MTKQLTTLSILLLFLSLPLSAYEKRDLLQKQVPGANELKNLLIPDRKWITYPDYPDRDGWDNLIGESKQKVIENGEKNLHYTWQVIPATEYLAFSRSGERVMQDKFNRNVNAISALMLAELSEGKGRFLDQLTNGVFHLCEMTSWVPSAHLNVQKAGGALPDHREQIIDLVSGDVGSLLSWIYYFFNKEFDKINPLISLRISDELNDRILTPFLTNDSMWWMVLNKEEGENLFVNNWNPWCNSNVLQCFLIMENDMDRLAEGVSKSLRSVDRFINYNHLDGACEEGPAYWGHAAGKMYDYLELLYDATGGKVSIFNEAIIRNMGEYISRSYVGDGWVVNFADASAKLSMDEQLIFRYGKSVGSDEMMQFGSSLASKKKLNLQPSRDIYRALKNFISTKQLVQYPPKHVHPSYTWYPQTEFCYMTGKDVFFAAKGGYNDESHNHNDIGTFSLYIDNSPFFIDAGVGTYTKQTFSSEHRYKIWTMQSNYHNLPVINGQPQLFGKEYRSKNARFNSASRTFSLDISGAYPAEAKVSKWVRSYKLTKQALEITDDYVLDNPGTPNVINFICRGEIDNSKAGEVHIRIDERPVILTYDKKTFDAEIERINIQDPRLTNVWGKEIYRISLKSKELSTHGKYIYKVKY